MSKDEDDIVFQLYKLSSTILPENNTRSIDEYINSCIQNQGYKNLSFSIG